MKYFLGIVVLLVIAVGAYMFTTKQAEAPAPAATNDSARSMAQTYNWKFEDVTPVGADIPRTKVSLVVSGGVNKTFAVGTYDGTCADVTTLTNEELSGVLCWFAGGGKELGVFTEGEGFVVKVGDQDEGSAEEVGFRGNFKTLFEIK